LQDHSRGLEQTFKADEIVIFKYKNNTKEKTEVIKWLKELNIAVIISHSLELNQT